ncbi:polymer-forming cytoskeletal protein [Hydrogenophaga sp. IBVHS2]|uniref:polymer-forming cytoskeletal protein n=1 Tax=Hydrogenophaga sp. IBVHS2 TaxID=1985170 RepID=UPI000A2E70C9|nr:polymer-forming cytoskeletal protein [Hydrogenophaga sp. IBVHS2]OSZ65793.1 hypothetical protein CAP38_07035 [Hydrogenophaga sp. IBVHS2]
MNPGPELALLGFLLLCGVLLIGPFAPAWLEWQRPTDRQALRPAAAAEPLPEIRSDRVVAMARHASFRGIEAPVIVFGRHRDAPPVTAGRPRPLHDHPLTPHPPLPGAQPWGDGGWRVEGDCTLQDHRHWQGSLVVTGVLSVGAGARVQGDIKAHRGIVIGMGTVVTGSVISDQGIRVFCDAVIGGPVLAESLLQLGAGVQLGSARAPTSVSACDMLVDDGVVVHGSLQAAQAGLVRGPSWA